MLSCFMMLGHELLSQQPKPCASEAEVQAIYHAAQVRWKNPEVKEKLQRMQNERTSADHILFGWPLRTTAEYDWIPNYYMIQNYVDLDMTANSTQDYSCGTRTYDGHNGIDINIWPFWWNIMNKQYVYVVAAAPGIVSWVSDNNGNDDNCSCTGSNNGISILHADGTTSLYFHIRDNSALVAEDQFVVEGQPIANVASSGCSSNPHLHFEVRDEDNARIEPFEGSCNGTTSDTWWKNQKPYWEPQINRIMTHGSSPSLQGYNGNGDFCTSGEFVNAKNNFSAGEVIYFGVGFHDIQANHSATFTVFYPDGDQWTSDAFSQGNSVSSRRYYAFARLLPFGAPSGTYTFRATYNGKSYYHYFTVGCTSSYTINAITITGDDGYVASSTIQSNATITGTGKVLLQAGGSITFNPNFTAIAGSELKARIKPCNYAE